VATWSVLTCPSCVPVNVTVGVGSTCTLVPLVTATIRPR
jgi:hypothetical protein